MEDANWEPFCIHFDSKDIDSKKEKVVYGGWINSSEEWEEKAINRCKKVGLNVSTIADNVFFEKVRTLSMHSDRESIDVFVTELSGTKTLRSFFMDHSVKVN